MYKKCNGTVKASIPPGTCQYEPTQSTSIHTPPHTHTHLRRHGVGGFDSDSLNSPTAPPHTETHRPQISRRTPCAELALVQAAAHTKVATPLRQCPSSVPARSGGRLRKGRWCRQYSYTDQPGSPSLPNRLYAKPPVQATGHMHSRQRPSSTLPRPAAGQVTGGDAASTDPQIRRGALISRACHTPSGRSSNETHTSPPATFTSSPAPWELLIERMLPVQTTVTNFK